MISYKYVVIAVICFTVVSSDEKVTQCMTSLGKYPFDVDQFSGTWYVVAKIKSPLEEYGDVTCAKINYETKESHLNMLISMKMADGKEIKLEGKGDAKGATCVMAWKSSQENKWQDAVHFSILASDYKTYALSHTCREIYDEATDSFSKIRHDAIWSREPSMDPVVLKTLQSVMSSLDIAEDDWDIVNNSGC